MWSPVGTVTVQAEPEDLLSRRRKALRVQEAIDQALAVQDDHVYVPDELVRTGGWDASLVNYDDSVRMVVEGGNPANWDLRAYGGAVDSETDDLGAFKAAIDAAAAAADTGGGIVQVPKGVAAVSDEIQLKHRVSLRGMGRGVTKVLALSSFNFTGTKAVVAIGETGTTTLAFNALVQDLTIDCNDVADSIGIYSELAQEMSGLKRVLVEDPKRYGVWFADGASTTAQNYLLRDVEVIIRNGLVGSTVGVKIDGGGGSARGIDGLTVNANTGIDAGLELDAVHGTAVFQRLHFEDCDPSVRIGATTGCFGLTIIGADYTNDSSGIAGTLIEIQTGEEITLMGLRKGDHNIAVDDQVNNHQVDRNYVGCYRLGRTLAPIATLPDGDTTPDVGNAEHFFTANTGATTISNFDGGQVGQRITVQAEDNNTTIGNGSNIRLSGSVDFAMSSGDTLTLVLMKSGVWSEIARMTR